jgi:hypothetical protein
MSAQNKVASVIGATHGFDDVGIAQPSGTISAVADGGAYSSRYAGKLMLTVNDTAALKKGQPIRIAALDSGHNGLTRILAIAVAGAPGKIIVDTDYNDSLVDGTGTWDCTGGESAWTAMMPLGANILGSNITFTFHFPERQSGSPSAAGIEYQQDQIYVFPGIIKSIVIATAGNVRLSRDRSPNPKM